MGILATSCATERASPLPSARRPEPARSAGDGEIMGADHQSPSDAIETSLTNEHPGPGWTVEDGKLVRSTELQNPGVPAEVPRALTERKGERDCSAESRQQVASTADAGLPTGDDEMKRPPRVLERSLERGCPKRRQN